MLSADAMYILFKKRGALAIQNLFAVCGTPDKMGSYLVGDMFGVLRIHTHQYTMCSSLEEVPVGAAFPLDES